MTAIKKVNFITGNKSKLAEVNTIIGGTIEVENQAVEVPEIQGTVEEIAKEKCKRAAEVVSSLYLGAPPPPPACVPSHLLIVNSNN